MKKQVSRIAVLASGNGTTLQAIIDAIKEKRLDLEIAIVVSNTPKAKALTRAETSSIRYHVLTGATEEERDNELYGLLKETNVHLVVSAGYLRPIGAKVRDNFTVINTHPSLLPKYGGKGMYGCMYIRQLSKVKKVNLG